MPQKCISEGTIGKNSFSKTVQRFPIGRIGVGIGTEMRSFEVVNCGKIPVNELSKS